MGEAFTDNGNETSTELVFILDRSGSMSGLEADTIGGFNAMLARQRGQGGACRITTILFDHNCRFLHDRIDIRAVAALTADDYVVGGSTALLDAIGCGIEKTSRALAGTTAKYRADKVLFVITTDGMENASRCYTYGEIRRMIEQRKHECGWEFVFLGANIDAEEVAWQFGIDRSRAQRYHNDSRGIALNYDVLSDTVCAFRAAPAGQGLDEEWKRDIAADFLARDGEEQ